MINENQLLEKFQIEELEKRYEFAWVDSAKIGYQDPATGGGIAVVVPL
jgi:hypothetical protein